MYEYYFFDLDGTLTNPGVGITNSVMYALEKYGIEVKERSELYCFIGPPLIDSFMKYYNFSHEQAEEAVVYYREYFGVKGILENEVYPEIPEVLSKLKERGIKLVLATSKPEPYARRILEYFELDPYFTFIGGATMDSSRSKKADVIHYVLEQLEIKDLSKVLMIGDRDQDINGAKANGLNSCGVTYGYGDRKELEKSGATYIVESPAQLLEIQ